MKHLIYFLILISISACAVIEDPSGGPKDTEPPKILSSYPANQTIDFKNNKIELNFSEYTNKQSVVQSIYISPKIEFESKWRRKKLCLYLKEDLNPAVTYTLTVGTEYTDMAGNKPNAAYSIIFSRGNKIDSGKIVGNVFSPAEDSYVFAYKLSGINPDTLNINHSKPDYIIPLGKTGDFVVNALKDGDYRLFVINDKFKDGKYDINTDGFSAASYDFHLENSRGPIAALRTGGVVDVIRPNISSFTPLSNQLYEIQLSEKFAKGLFTDNFITVENISKTINYKDFTLFTSPKSTETYYLYTKTPLDTNENWKITFSNLLIDSAGNNINDSTRILNFKSISDKMKLVPKLEKFINAESSSALKLEDTLTFAFNFPIQTDSIIYAISIFSAKDSARINYSTIKDNYPNILKIRPLDWKYGTDYYLTLYYKNIISSDGSHGTDSAKTFNLKTINPSDYSAVSGTLQAENRKFGSWVIMLNSKSNHYTVLPNQDGNWKIDGVFPDAYNVTVFFDSNGDRKISNGYPFPYVPAENCFYMKTPITVKKGWSTDNVKLVAR